MIVATDANGPGRRLEVRAGELTVWEDVPARFFRKNFSEAFKYSRGLAAWLWQHVGEFDIVHIHSVLSHAPLAAAAACRRARVPYIVRPLGTIAPWSLQQKPWRKRALLALGAQRMLREAAAVHYTSEEEKLGAERALGISGGVVIPLGVDEALLNKPTVGAHERARAPYVLALSRLHPKKNLETLIESFLSIAEVAGWQLVIAGAGENRYARTLERLVEERQAGHRVKFVGWVAGEEKDALISRASLFAMPSLHENFGVSLVEALAAGVPALVSRQVQLADAVAAAGAGWIVGSDFESLRLGLIDALKDAEERDRRGAAARALARRFAWTSVAGQLMELYERLAGARASAGRQAEWHGSDLLSASSAGVPEERSKA